MEGPADHTVLIRKILEERGRFTSCPPADAGDGEPLGLCPDAQKVSSVVLAEDALLELGAPGRLSVSRALWTRQPGLVDNRVLVHGDDVAGMKGRSCSFLLFVLLELPPDLDPDQAPVATLMNLTHRLRWVMTRALPGRLWVRVHKKIFPAFSLLALARTIRTAYAARFPQIERVDVLIAADDDDFIRGFEGHATAAGVISGESRRLRWEQDGEISCSDLDCRVCDEKPVCDTIRNVIAFRRRR